MKSLFAGVFLFVFFASCSKDYKPRKLDNVYIKECVLVLMNMNQEK